MSENKKRTLVKNKHQKQHADEKLKCEEDRLTQTSGKDGVAIKAESVSLNSAVA
jgi:hypothetical protein